MALETNSPFPILYPFPKLPLEWCPLWSIATTWTYAQYPTAWWDCYGWQRELDWIAMSGINLPLSFAGQECVWWQLYPKVGLTEQIFDYISGPVFLAWQCMGNIKKLAGPLSESWCLAQCDLQINILARSRQLGVLSVLPGFVSHATDALVTLYPGHKFIQTTKRGYLNDTYTKVYLLEPTDPFFVMLSKMFH